MAELLVSAMDVIDAQSCIIRGEVGFYIQHKQKLGAAVQAMQQVAHKHGLESDDSSRA
jgi:hypothetical protein